jgi:hypothetical protein
MGDQSEIQATERKAKIPYDKYATSKPVCQFTTPTLKISFTTTKFLDIGRGSVGNLATRREPVPTDGPKYQRNEGGFEEPNILDEPE